MKKVEKYRMLLLWYDNRCLGAVVSRMVLHSVFKRTDGESKEMNMHSLVGRNIQKKMQPFQSRKDRMHAKKSALDAYPCQDAKEHE